MQAMTRSILSPAPKILDAVPVTTNVVHLRVHALSTLLFFMHGSEQPTFHWQHDLSCIGINRFVFYESET